MCWPFTGVSHLLFTFPYFLTYHFFLFSSLLLSSFSLLLPPSSSSLLFLLASPSFLFSLPSFTILFPFPSQAEASFGPQLSALCEVRCLVCSYLHQMFIAEPSMVKLVHFQGYPLQLLPMMVSGVPSMHICLDFIPELLAQPETHKQVHMCINHIWELVGCFAKY